MDNYGALIIVLSGIIGFAFIIIMIMMVYIMYTINETNRAMIDLYQETTKELRELNAKTVTALEDLKSYISFRDNRVNNLIEQLPQQVAAAVLAIVNKKDLF